jgi:hypothetical protein
MLMIHLLILAVHLLATIAKLLRPGGVRAVVAESLLLRHLSFPKIPSVRNRVVKQNQGIIMSCPSSELLGQFLRWSNGALGSSG